MSSPVGRHCLIAEADPFIASLLARYMEDSGLECVQARTADDVIELARRVSPAVIIIDAELPGVAVGWEVMRALKLDAATGHIAQISCSWLSETEVRGLVHTIAGHLQKPDISYSEFESVLRAAGVSLAARQTTEAPWTNPHTKGQRL